MTTILSFTITLRTCSYVLGNTITSAAQVVPGTELIVSPDPVLPDPADPANPAAAFRTATVFCVVYDHAGMMVHLQSWDVDLSDPERVRMTGRIRIPEGVSVGEIRVIVLSENLVPLEAAEILG